MTTLNTFFYRSMAVGAITTMDSLLSPGRWIHSKNIGSMSFVLCLRIVVTEDTTKTERVYQAISY